MKENSIRRMLRVRVGPGVQTCYAAAVLAVMAVLLIVGTPGWHWKPAILTRDVFAPGAGRALALPPDALDGIALIERHGLREYTPGPDLRKRNLIVQRIIEGAYPLRPARVSAHVIDYRSGIDTAACSIVETRGRMVYARCHAR